MNDKLDLTALDTNHLVKHIRQRNALIQKDISIIAPWLLPCRVKVLLVTDGSLSFGMDDFGLSAFLDCLLHDGRFYVKFDITLAHLRSNASAAEMGTSIPGIVNRITDFRFDNPAHFSSALYDQVWLFGIETNFHQAEYAFRNAHRAIFPSNRLSDAELVTISSFMQNGGGVFATGDHGALGQGLCGSIIRVRSMRLWDSNVVNGQDEVSMIGARRNDTNQIGDAGSQFSDQSDDIPQTILPKYYYHIFHKYPHPLLCSKLGVINVLPDHPHEGECIVPANPGLNYSFDGSVEYPNDLNTGVQVLPEIIARSQVVSGNTGSLGPTAGNPSSFSKTPTTAHDFGAISAYDGHRAGVGRVVTDATWHHFINVNLIGILEGGRFDDLTAANSPTKHDGFMSTPAGQAHMAKIKEYYVNIGVWIAPPAKISCFNSKFWWKLLYSDRVMEAALSNPDIQMSRISVGLYHSIGVHARDVLGRAASPCQSWAFVIDLSKILIREFVPFIDPWGPLKDPKEGEELDLPGFDVMPMMNVAIGAALVALRQEFPFAPEKFDEKFAKKAEKITLSAARMGLELAVKHFSAEAKQFSNLLNTCMKTYEK